jgi:hypothetical protein
MLTYSYSAITQAGPRCLVRAVIAYATISTLYLHDESDILMFGLASTIIQALKSTRVLSAARDGYAATLGALVDVIDSGLRTFPAYAAAAQACDVLSPSQCREAKVVLLEEIVDLFKLKPAITAIIRLASVVPPELMAAVSSQVEVLSDFADLVSDPSLSNLNDTLESVADLAASATSILDSIVLSGDFDLTGTGFEAALSRLGTGDPALIADIFRDFGLPDVAIFVEDNVPRMPGPFAQAAAISDTISEGDASVPTVVTAIGGPVAGTAVALVENIFNW